MLPSDSLVLDGRFRVIRPIGSGGMGEVYLGEQVSLGRKVAIKVLHHDLHKQHGMVERFKREARLLSAVEHPAVVRIIDFGESEHSACLVMELVEGDSLFELLRNGPLAPARALTVLHQLAEGLAAIHDKGIIHRDIKPENVFLTRTPRGEQARLLDFGIARLVEPDADSNVSQVGVVLGTPEYLSPEQAIGARVDVRSDLYCLGVLAYRVLSGRLPFDGPSPRHYISQHANAAPLPLDRAAPALAIHPTLVALVMRLLEKDPANRFQSAHSLADALAAAAAGPLPETVMPPPGILVPESIPSPPVASGTAAFGAAPPEPSLPAAPPVAAPPAAEPPPAAAAPPVASPPVASDPAPATAAPPVPAQAQPPPPVASGTAAFGAEPPVPPRRSAPPVPSYTAAPRIGRGPVREFPPTGSGTAVFGSAPPAPSPVSSPIPSESAPFGRSPVASSPVVPASGSDKATYGAPASVPWDPSVDSDTAVARGAPSASVPWDPPADGDTDVWRGAPAGSDLWDAPVGSSTAVFRGSRPLAATLPPPTGSGTALFGAASPDGSPPPPSSGTANAGAPAPTPGMSGAPSPAPAAELVASKLQNLTLMLTSIQGFAELASRQPREEQLRILEKYEELLLPMVRDYEGKLVQKLGDLLLAVFESPSNAVLCGMGLQDRLWRHNQGQPPDAQLHVRVCLHAGEVLLTPDTVVGEPMEVVKAVEQVALAGEVTFTEAVNRVRNGAEVAAEPCGTMAVPGRGESLQLHRCKHIATEGAPFGGRDLVSAPTQKRPVIPWKPLAGALRQKVSELAQHRTHRLAGVGILGGLLLILGVGLWAWNRSPEVQARRLLADDKPAEALKRIDTAPVEDRKTPELRQVRAMALHAMKRHSEEYLTLLALVTDNHHVLEEPLLDGLAADFGADESDKVLRRLLEALPKDTVHAHFEALAEGDASPKQWGALRYLEASQQTEDLDLVELYTNSLASEDCGVRAKAARRLGGLGNADAVPALTKLAAQPRDQELNGSKNCGQEEAAAALQTLKKPD